MEKRPGYVVKVEPHHNNGANAQMNTFYGELKISNKFYLAAIGAAEAEAEVGIQMTSGTRRSSTGKKSRPQPKCRKKETGARARRKIFDR